MSSVIQVGETTTARRVVKFTLRNSSGTALTGEALNVTIRVLKDGVSATGAGSVSEPDATNFPGLYDYTMSAGEVGTSGAGVIRPTLAGAVSADWPFAIVEYDPFSAPETSADVATATRVEMDSNSTKLSSILTALNVTVITSGSVTTGGSANATSVTLPTGLVLKSGDLLFFLTSRASAVVDTYTTGTGVTALTTPGLNAAVSNGESFIAYQAPTGNSADDVWSSSTRTLTSGGVSAIASASRIEMDSNSTQLDAILSAVNVTTITSGSVTTGGSSAATSITLPTGLLLKDGDILFFSTSKASAVVESYITGTGVTTLAEPGLNAAVSNGETFTAYQSPAGGSVDDVWAATARTLTSGGVDAIASASRIEMDSNSTQLSGIVSSLTTIASYIDTEIAAILEDTGTTIPGLIAALNNISATEINAEIVDALSVDTYAEPGSVPSATAPLSAKIGWMFTLARNKVLQTATSQSLRNDADTATIASASVADDGTTFTRGEWA